VKGMSKGVGRDIGFTKAIITPERSNHIFSKKPGKLLDTKANRSLLIELSSNPKHLLGVDRFGVKWYAKINANGRQIYSTVNKKGEITGAGIHEIPRSFSKANGLRKKQTPK